jgi:hypothetical protein
VPLAVLDNHISKTQVTSKWVNGQLSNFEYLMYLNKASGRSVQDGSQYPIFPWCVNSYSGDFVQLQEPKYFRNFDQPIGQLLQSERITVYDEKYAEMRLENEPNPYFYGSFYSNPAITLYYQMRLEPYTKYSSKLVGNLSEIPERVFFSVIKHFHNVTHNVQDVKEPIPEFFYFPEMLINNNRIGFSETSSDNWRLDYVELPKWAKNNPFVFVYIQTKILESEQVSQAIHKWIDLIFGSCQRGNKAHQKKNVYHPMVYPELAFKNYKLLKEHELNAFFTQIYHFGQLPLRLLETDHPSKHSLSSVAKRYCYSNSNLKLSIQSVPEVDRRSLSRTCDLQASEEGLKISTNLLIKTYKFGVYRATGRVEKVNLSLHANVEVSSKVSKDLVTKPTPTAFTKTSIRSLRVSRQTAKSISLEDTSTAVSNL